MRIYAPDLTGIFRAPESRENDLRAAGATRGRVKLSRGGTQHDAMSPKQVTRGARLCSSSVSVNLASPCDHGPTDKSHGYSLVCKLAHRSVRRGVSHL